MMTGAQPVSTPLPLPPAAFSNAALAASRKLGDFESVTGRLVAGEVALQAYELDGRAGHQVRLRVTSDAFHVVAFVVFATPQGPAFSRVVPGVAPAAAGALGGPEALVGGVELQPPVTLPANGVYRIVVTSVENQAERRAASSGEYRMNLLVDAPSVEAPVESERGTRFSAWESDSH